MAISLIKQKGINPITKAVLWFLRWTRVQTVTKKQLARIMSRGSTFSVGECEGLITDIAEFVTDQLLAGNAVQLDGLGTLKLKVSGKAKAKKEDVTSQSATISVVFEPDADMEARLNAEKQFQFVEKATADGEQDTSDPQTDPTQGGTSGDTPAASGPVLTVTKTGNGTLTVTDQTGHQIESGASVAAGQTLTIAVTPAGSATPTATIGGQSVVLAEDEGQYVGTFQMPSANATLTVRTGGSGDNDE